MLTLESKRPRVLFEKHNIGNKNLQREAKWPLTTNLHLVCNDTGLSAYKTGFCLLFEAGLEHMGAWPRGNGPNFNWLR